MNQNYQDTIRKMTVLAGAYAAHCAQAEQGCVEAQAAEQSAFEAAQRRLYAVPKEQLRVDLEAMQNAAAAFAQVQDTYPGDPVLLSDCMAEAKPRKLGSMGCVEAFRQCAQDFTKAAQTLESCPPQQDATYLQMMAKCLVTAEYIYANLPQLLDENYPIASAIADSAQRLEDQKNAIRAAADQARSVTTFPDYETCKALAAEIRTQAQAQQKQLLSCSRLDDNTFPDAILLGRTPFTLDDATKQFWTEQLSMSDADFNATALSLPIGKASSSVVLNVTGAQAESKELESLLVTWFLQFVAAFPTKSLHVCGLQGDLSGIVSSLVSELTSAVGEDVTFGGPKATEAAIAAGIDEVSRLMEERVRFYGRKYDDIYDYNSRAQESPHYFVLLMIHNYPYAFEDRAVRKKVENLIESGGRCGILTLLVNRPDAKLERFGEPVPPLDTTRFGSLTAEYVGGMQFRLGGLTYTCDIAAPDFSEEQLWAQLADSTRYVSRPIMLDTILQQPYDARPYYDELKIPVGRSGNDLAFFRLDIESTGKAAALVAGGTGSGKTTFLHTLILSGASHYSPDELEFYLIDFKDGVEFSNYLKKDGEPSAYIPHVSFVSLKNRVEDAYDVLHKISALKTERNRLFSQAGATDFKTYHLSKKVQSGELPKLKRTIVIIDEYQNMLEPAGSGSAVLASKCASRLLALLKEVRNAGISIVLSSQAICVGREAKDQIFNRIVFSGSENTINSAFETTRSADMMSELQRERGLAYLSEDGGVHTTLLKAAWAGKTNGAEHQATAAAICEKWADAKPTHMIISGNPRELPVGEGCSALSLCSLPDMEADAVYPAVIGQSFLSDEPVTLDFTSAEFSSYIVIGDLAKARSVEAAAALSFLQLLLTDDCVLTDAVRYCDINYTSEGRRHRSPLETLAPQLDGMIRCLKNERDVADEIAALHTLYHDRLEALKQGHDIDMTPRLLIISSVHSILEFNLDGGAAAPSGGEMSAFDQLLMDTAASGGSGKIEETIRQLELLYERGFEQHIFVMLSDKEPQRLRELIPRGIRYEKGVYCSRAALAAAEWSNAGEHISVDELADNCCIVLPNVSKVRPYQFDDCDAWFAAYRTLLT